MWPFRAMSIAVEARAADVPDNRPLSGRFADRSLFSAIKQQLDEKQSRERRLVDGDVAASRSDDDVAVNGDMPHGFG